MDLVILVCWLVLIGYGVYLLTTRVKMHPEWAIFIRVLAFLALAFWALQKFAPLPNVLR